MNLYNLSLEIQGQEAMCYEAYLIRNTNQDEHILHIGVTEDG